MWALAVASSLSFLDSAFSSMDVAPSISLCASFISMESASSKSFTNTESWLESTVAKPPITTTGFHFPSSLKRSTPVSKADIIGAWLAKMPSWPVALGIDHLRAGHCHAISFWWQDLVGRTKWPLWDVAIGETTCYTWYTSYTCDMFNLLWFSSEKNKNETDIGRNQKKTLQVHNLKSSISKSIPFPIAFSFRRSPGAATFSGSSSSSALLATTLRRCVAGLPTKLSMLRLPSRTRAPKRRKDNTGERAMMKVVKKVEVFRCAKAKIPGPITPWAKKIETKFKHEPWLLYTETEINNAILRSSKNKNKENSATWIK